ncbi:MAG: aminotransferase class I/II-fold pyridoxal phosphate-dependent enzyme [Alphaproteobacteria bacterium]|nr:aminotransferase class I/II-fold pyridoxal phosphate-dependent enzyme [Alphaproteobacteria bacterium]
MVLKVASRGHVPPFIVMDVMKSAADREAEGGDVLHLEVGQPATSAPRGVIEAAKRALDQDKLGYTLAFGLPKLRERISEHYKAWYGLDVPVDRIAITKGSSAGFLLSFLTAFDPGDRVAMVSPGYPAYRNILAALGIEPVLMLSGPEHRFQPTPALMDALDAPVDGLILASPSNPTGTMVGDQEMRALTSYCKAKGIRMISDEIYHGIGFGTQWVSALESDPKALVINSFSKYFSMTGWRLGWMIVPTDMVRAVECLAQNMFISSPTLSQHAAIAAFDCHEELQDNIRHYARNREILLNDLPAAGLTDLAPADGAFYVYANVADITNDSVDFCRRMLSDTGVACTPGVDFDPDRGHATIRFSFAGSTDDMVEACRRMKDWIRR